MTTFASALYEGQTWHRRYRPVEHALRYGLFMLLVDLDELPALDRAFRWFGHNRAGLLSFYECDHGDGSRTPLRTQVEAHLKAAGLPSDGPIRVLSMPRVLGQVFNPLTIYYCFPREGGSPHAMLYEVNNTFGQRHSYLLQADGSGNGRVHHGTDKRFYVSPFMDMALTYRFRLRTPSADDAVGAPLSVNIEVASAGDPMLTAAFLAKRETLSDATLLRAVLGHPLLMLKVVSAIHWEALKLWLKGMKLRPRPALPPQPVSYAPAAPRDP